MGADEKLERNAESLTESLARLRSGETAALHEVFESSYDELRRIAHARIFAARAGNRFATESLVHESFFKLRAVRGLSLPDRRYFFGYASKVMRSIILLDVRAENALRRGKGLVEVTLDTGLEPAGKAPGFDVEAVHDALCDLEKLSPDWAALVEMRFFGGLTETEIAETLQLSERTVRREWEKARAALSVLLTSD